MAAPKIETSTDHSVNRTSAGVLFVFALPLAAQQPAAVPVTNTSTYNHDTAPTVRAARLIGRIEIDGKLDEPAWAAATPVSDFTQHDPKEGMPASEKTEVRVVVGDDALYVGARMTDKPANIRPRLSRRDEPVDGDVFAVSLDSRHDHNSAYYFRVTAGGAVRDATVSPQGVLDLSWDAVWEAKVSHDATGWTAEIRIPLSQLPYNRNQDSWGIQFERYSWNKQEQDLFAFTPKSQAGGINRFGHLTGLGALPAPKRLELLPYASSRGEYLNVAAGNPFRGKDAYFGSAGLDLKYRIASNLTLNATVNPDFGQVEVDPAVVNLTAFETFFPEKRPFFVQDQSLFNFGEFRTFNSYGEPTVFFSRRIGRSPQRSLDGGDVAYVDAPQQTTIATAAKVTGKSRNGWSTGILDAVTTSEHADYTQNDILATSHAEVEPLTNYFVGRFRREMNQANTAAGGLITAVNRDLSDPTLAHVLRSSGYFGGLDLNHAWSNRSWLLDFAGGASVVQGNADVIAATQQSSAHYFQRPDSKNLEYDPTLTSMGGYAGHFAITKAAGLHWGGNVAAQVTSPGFEVNDLGFMRTADRQALSTDLYYTQNTPGKLFRDWLVTGFTNQTWNYDHDIIFNNYASFFQATLPDFSLMFLRVDFSGPTIEDRLTRGGPVARMPRGISTEILYATDRRKQYTAQFGVSYSHDQAGASSQNYGIDFAVQPAPGIRVTVSPALHKSHSLSQFVTSSADQLATSTYGRRYVFSTLDQTALSVVTRADWTFTPALSLQIYAQPLVASGGYRDFKELHVPRTFDFDVYGRDRGTIELSNGVYRIDPDANANTANSVAFGNPDFNFRSLRGNAVVRWEYRPGSTLFFVWQQQRSGEEPLADFRFGRDYGALFQQKPENVFTVKATYWLAR
jgi:Domain of unknown function (DUF5916)/Carbohydrate family 9 binding domain-like